MSLCPEPAFAKLVPVDPRQGACPCQGPTACPEEELAVLTSAESESLARSFQIPPAAFFGLSLSSPTPGETGRESDRSMVRMRMAAASVKALYAVAMALKTASSPPVQTTSRRSSATGNLRMSLCLGGAVEPGYGRHAWSSSSNPPLA